MSLKKISCLFVAMLLLVGTANVANAATPQGVRLRIIHPASGTWAGIGDSVVVRVQFLPGTANLTNVEVAIVADTTATTVALMKAALANGGPFQKAFVAGDASAADSDGFKAFTTTFLVSAGQSLESSTKSLVLQAFVKTASLAFTQMNNQNSDATINGSSTFQNVGDQSRIGIDANRPTGQNITSVVLDTTGIGDFPNDGGGSGSNGKNESGSPKKAYKVGSKVKVTFLVTNIASGDKGIVHFVDTADVAAAAISDSAMKTIEFTFAQLVSGSTSDSTTVTMGSGNFKGNNRRMVAVAFLRDAAGNLSNKNSANGLTPLGVTDVNMHVWDVTPPKITPLVPKSGTTDSTFFTGVVDTTMGIVPTAGGAVASIKFAASPLKFTSSEGAKSASANFADTTLTLAIAGFASGSTASFATDFGSKARQQAGKKADLTLTVTDSVGNKTTSKQAAVTYDQVAPGAKAGSFPTSATAPPDVSNSSAPTVNRDTMMPILQLLEETDSLAAQWVEVTAGTAKSIKHKMAPGNPDLKITDKEIRIVFTDTLFSKRKYTLQLLFRDLAGNHNATVPDTMTFNQAFKNPVADSFVVAADNKDIIVIAGQGLILDITGIDTALTNSSKSQRNAVTHAAGATIRIDAGEQDISGVTFSGKGLTDNKNGTASLDAAGWTLGKRSVVITSKRTLSAFAAYVENKTGDDVNYAGKIGSLQVDAGNLSTYNVTVVENTEGGDSATGVSGNFKVMVQPADDFGNPSTKTYSNAGVPTRSDSTGLRDAKVDKKLVLGEIFVAFSSNSGDVGVPQGPQAVGSAGSIFTIAGASESGEGLRISVRTVSASGDTLGSAAVANTDHDHAIGSTGALTFAPEGEAPPTAGGALAAPANLIVQDWLGSDGSGDQGGFVSVAFPASDGASRYRIFRELSVKTGLNDAGAVVALEEPVTKWVPWTVLDHISADAIQRAVVPTLDNVATNWAVASEAGGASSERTANKRVFTKQIVQNMIQYLGVDPNRVLSMTELAQLFTPSEDYVKSIIGDRMDIRFAAIDPDLTAMLGGTSTVPQNIRTQAGGVNSSARTATEEPVAAVDNIPPAAITELAYVADGGAVTLSWTESVDDHIVGFSSYKGYAVPIAGVDRYDIYGGKTEDALELVGSVPGGVTSFIDAVSSVIYRVDAADLDNSTPAPIITVSVDGRPVWLNAEGVAIFIINEADGTPLIVDFGDFISFAGSFNLTTGEAGFVANADTNDDGIVNFEDFLGFAASFNQTAVSKNGAPIGNTKPLIRTLLPGVNDNVELSLSLGSGKVIVGQTVTLNVTVDNAASLQGFGFDLSYDTDKFEFVKAVPAQEDLLSSGGAETPVFLLHQSAPGELSIANAIVDGSPVTGNGDVVSLTFQVLTEFEDNARFEIANGVVFDGSLLSNAVVALGSLSVESTPTEFALLQNFPNPFNPETTIKYNIAEGGNVSLRIYNVVGQVVNTLVAEQQSAGRYTVRWNGTDDRGVSVSSGIYFYQITAGGDFGDVKKLMLLK